MDTKEKKKASEREEESVRKKEVGAVFSKTERTSANPTTTAIDCSLRSDPCSKLDSWSRLESHFRTDGKHWGDRETIRKRKLTRKRKLEIYSNPAEKKDPAGVRIS